MAEVPTVSRRGFLFGAAAAMVGGVQAYRYLRGPSGPDLWAVDFGATGDGIIDDGPALRRAVDATRAAGPGATLRLGGGRYRVGGAPNAGYALPVSGARGLSIVGDGATLVVSNPALGCLSLSDCDGCRVEGIAIDYDPPPFTETIVTAVNPRGRTLDVEVVLGYPLFDAGFFSFAAMGERHPSAFGAVFDSATRRMKGGVVDYVFLTSAAPLGRRSFRLQTRDGLPVGLSPGDAFVYLARQGGHALACYRSPGTSVRDVHVCAANAVAFALIESDAARITRCRVAVKPGSRRLVSTNADGVHAQGCRVGPAVADCTFSRMMDDGVNIYAPPVEILALRSNQDVVVAGGSSIRTGDRLEFSDPVSGRLTGVRRVKTARLSSSGAKLHLTLTAPVPGLSASVLDGIPDAAFNLDASGEGYLIRNNRFTRHRGHAMRLHTGRGIVEGNRIRHTSRDGILVSNDPDWPEGPHTRNLILRGNTLESTGGDAAIDVEGRKSGARLADRATQRNIRIEGNKISNWRGSAIAVGAAHHISIRNNLLILDARAGHSVAEQGILLERAHDVEIDGVVLRSSEPETLTAAIVLTSTVAGGQRRPRIRDVRAPTGLDVVQDRRDDQPTYSLRRQRSRAADAAQLASRLGVLSQ